MSEEAKEAVAENNVDVSAIEAQVRAKIQQEFEAEKEKILGNRDQILQEKKELEARYKGFDQEEFDQFRQFQERKQKDEMLALAADGKFEELSHKLMSAREKAWNETQQEYEDRLKSAQTKAEEFESMVKSLEQKNLDMKKRQYFKDLTGSDESFKSDYFSDFFALQAGRADIDEDAGAVYALDENGKRMIDTDGNFVKFEDHYNKLKIRHGLFWNVGSGSGHKGGPGGDALGTDPSKWSNSQKIEFISENGREAYAKLLASSNRK